MKSVDSGDFEVYGLGLRELVAGCHRMEISEPLLKLAYDILMPVVVIVVKVSSPWPQNHSRLEVELEGYYELIEAVSRLELDR